MISLVYCHRIFWLEGKLIPSCLKDIMPSEKSMRLKAWWLESSLAVGLGKLTPMLRNSTPTILNLCYRCPQPVSNRSTKGKMKRQNSFSSAKCSSTPYQSATDLNTLMKKSKASPSKRKSSSFPTAKSKHKTPTKASMPKWPSKRRFTSSKKIKRWRSLLT